MFDHNAPTRDIAIPFFYTEAAEDVPATRQNGGVPVFRDEIMVRIKIPGSRDEVCRPVCDEDKRRWPGVWAQFEKGLKQQLDGTPMAEFLTATAAERATAMQLGIQTVEQLAGLPDSAALKSNIIGLKQKAEKFLRSREQFANVGKLEATIAALQKRIEELESGKNSDATVSGGDGGDGVHASDRVSQQPRAGRKKNGPAGEPGRDGANQSP